MLKVDNQWLSAYLYFGGGIYSYEADRIILEIVKPFIKKCEVNNWIDKYFFIRYSENGPHIRLRLFGNKETVYANIKPALIEFVGANFPEDLIPNRNNSNNNNSNSSDNLIFVDYQPELERYGGESAIVTAEDMFFYSSNTCVELLSKINKGEHSARLGKGLLCMAILMYVFSGDRNIASDFADKYHAGYLKSLTRSDEKDSVLTSAFGKGFDNQSQALIEYINTIWEMLDEHQELPGVFACYYNNLIKIKENLKKLYVQGKFYYDHIGTADFNIFVRRVASSYLHMMNNRLGISIPEESYLAFLLKQTLAGAKSENGTGEKINGKK